MSLSGRSVLDNTVLFGTWVNVSCECVYLCVKSCKFSHIASQHLLCICTHAQTEDEKVFMSFSRFVSAVTFGPQRNGCFPSESSDLAQLPCVIRIQGWWFGMLMYQSVFVLIAGVRRGLCLFMCRWTLNDRFSPVKRLKLILWACCGSPALT